MGQNILPSSGEVLIYEYQGQIEDDSLFYRKPVKRFKDKRVIWVNLDRPVTMCA